MPFLTQPVCLSWHLLALCFAFPPIWCRNITHPPLLRTHAPPKCPHRTQTAWNTCPSGCWCCRPPHWCSPCATLVLWKTTVCSTWPHPPWCRPRWSRSSSASCWSSWSAVSTDNQGRWRPHLTSSDSAGLKGRAGVSMCGPAVQMPTTSNRPVLRFQRARNGTVAEGGDCEEAFTDHETGHSCWHIHAAEQPALSCLV